ncbi:MAG: hypothetical protein HZB51_03865 [Chloroflexi bacterium]|nr:hypothetical protein [Chloroflexota bacterium]
MKLTVTIPGLIGIALAFLLYAVASALSTIIPILLQGNLWLAILFLFFLALSFIEIPMMIFGLRQMAHSATTPRRLVAGTFAFYAMFAAVYASIFVLLTGQIGWGSALAALSFVRFASGIALR